MSDQSKPDYIVRQNSGGRWEVIEPRSKAVLEIFPTALAAGIWARQRIFDKQEAALLQAINPLLEMRGSMPLRCVQALLLVALYPGESVTDLAKRANMSVSTMSRNLRDLGDSKRNGDPGHRLVEGTPQPANEAALAYRLTPRGRALLDKVLGPQVSEILKLKEQP